MGDGVRRSGRLARRRRRMFGTLAVATAVVVGVGVGIGVAVSSGGPKPPGAADMPWPVTGVAAVSVGDGEALGPGADQPHPMASLTKLVTALAVLDAAPLTEGDDGPTFVLDELDTAITAQEQTADGVAVALPAGTRVTERHLLELTLVASANDAARSLARHVFGDESTFAARARAWLDVHGLRGVTVADAAGMSAANAAPARDLLALGRLATADPTISSIAAMPSVVRDPLAGPEALPNTDTLRGRFGIDGLKTGHTDEAGYAVLFTAPLGDASGARVVGVVLGAPSAAQRDTDAARILAHVRSAAR